MQPNRIKILLVESGQGDTLLGRDVIDEICSWQIDVDRVCQFDAAMKLIGRGQHDVHLIEGPLGAHSGLEVARRALAANPKTPNIVIADSDTLDINPDSRAIAAVDVIAKDELNLPRLRCSIRYALQQRHDQAVLERTNTLLREKTRDLQRLALGVEAAGEAIMMTNLRGNIEYVNPAFTRLTGYGLEEVTGQNPRILHGGQQDRGFYERLWQTILAGKTWSGQVTNRHKSGSFYEAQLVIAAVKDEQGRVHGFVSVHNNITPFKQVQAALEDANRALEMKNKKLADLTETAHRFVDNVAHDFRTPLTVIKEFTSIIADGLGGPITSPQAEYLQFINTATGDLAQMVDDFLDSSKLKAHVLRVARQPIQVQEIISAARPMLRSRAASKQIQLIEEIPSDLPPVFADSEKVARILINLVVNAIKFSPANSDIRLWAADTDSGDVRIGVTDHGPGLDAHELAVVFDRFKQVGDVQGTATKGFGLGLSIAKELVWLNLGQVHVESEPGHGSTFSFTLPPCDRSMILKRYFQRISELDESVECLTVLQIEPVQSDADIGELSGFLSSVCYPMDLVLMDDNEDSILVIGVSNQPDKWIERLAAARDSAVRKAANKELSAWRIRCLGKLAGLPIQESSVLTAIHQLAELQACA